MVLRIWSTERKMKGSEGTSVSGIRLLNGPMLMRFRSITPKRVCSMVSFSWPSCAEWNTCTLYRPLVFFSSREPKYFTASTVGYPSGWISAERSVVWAPAVPLMKAAHTPSAVVARVLLVNMIFLLRRPQCFVVPVQAIGRLALRLEPMRLIERDRRPLAAAYLVDDCMVVCTYIL